MQHSLKWMRQLTGSQYCSRGDWHTDSEYRKSFRYLWRKICCCCSA